ncbi:MAG: HAD family phosphatase [Phycisphaerales bacterium]|nr:HAD family phosphatase [Phycisphaerales bacterium]
MNPFAAIFDLDGTLVDSCDCHQRAWAALGDSLGIQVSREFFFRFFGRPNPPIIKALFAEAGRDEPSSALIQSLAIHKEEIFRALVGAAFPLMPGTHALLNALHCSGWLLAIGSSAPPTNVQFMLNGIAATSPFAAVVSGDCVPHGKPHPDVFLEAARRLKLLPTDCIVIEDAAPGVEAAHRAGMKCVALCSAGHTHEELRAADLIINHLDELTPSRLQSLIYQ